MNGSFTAIDLFAGCGGVTTGLKAAGFNVQGAVEIDDVAVSIFKLNHPEVTIWPKAIEDVSGDAIKKRLSLRVGELDLLAGCPPCQGFSTVRTLNGGKRIRDKRNDLIYEFQRLVRELKPKAVMLENVPGLASNRRMRDFENGLTSIGYHAHYKILDAADYGVPQRRKRMILLAGRFGCIRFARQAIVRRTVRDAIGGLKPAGLSGERLHDIPEKRAPAVLERIALIPKDGGSRMDLPDEYQLDCHRRCNGFKDIYGRMAWDQVAPTLTTGCFNPSKGRFIHPQEDRGITMREAALLQSFPKRYKFPTKLGRSILAMHIGNALPPEFVKRHAKAVHRYLMLALD